jgi:hypothetical protein
MTLDEMFARLDKRRSGFEILYDKVQRSKYPLIVETGCTRQLDNWFGDGQSSQVFNAMAELHDGTIYSVDIDPAACQFAKSVTGPRHHIFCGDSVAWLQQAEINFDKMGRKIDVLYLDSYDLDLKNWHPSAQHHIYELLAIKGALGPGTLVAVDDNVLQPDGRYFGKGAYVAQWMSMIGKRQLHQGYQWIWEW